MTRVQWFCSLLPLSWFKSCCWSDLLSDRAIFECWIENDLRCIQLFAALGQAPAASSGTVWYNTIDGAPALNITQSLLHFASDWFAWSGYWRTAVNHCVKPYVLPVVFAPALNRVLDHFGKATLLGACSTRFWKYCSVLWHVDFDRHISNLSNSKYPKRSGCVVGSTPLASLYLSMAAFYPFLERVDWLC